MKYLCWQEVLLSRNIPQPNNMNLLILTNSPAYTATSFKYSMTASSKIHVKPAMEK